MNQINKIICTNRFKKAVQKLDDSIKDDLIETLRGLAELKLETNHERNIHKIKHNKKLRGYFDIHFTSKDNNLILVFRYLTNGNLLILEIQHAVNHHELDRLNNTSDLSDFNGLNNRGESIIATIRGKVYFSKESFKSFNDFPEEKEAEDYVIYVDRSSNTNYIFDKESSKYIKIKDSEIELNESINPLNLNEPKLNDIKDYYFQIKELSKDLKESDYEDGYVDAISDMIKAFHLESYFK